MKHLVFQTFLILCCTGTTVSQNIEILWQNNSYTPAEKVHEFEYIDFKMDLSGIDTKIAEYKLTIDKQGKNNLASIFQKIWDEANKKGANAFSIENVLFENDKYIVFLDTYFFDDPLLDENYSLYEDNIIIVFGDLNTKNEEKFKTIKIDKKKYQVHPYEYLKIQNEPLKKVNISIGGALGSSVSIIGETGKLPVFLSLGGFNAMPSGGSVSVGSGRGGTAVGMGVGVQIKTGSIYPMNLNFGFFTMTILYSLGNRETE